MQIPHGQNANSVAHRNAQFLINDPGFRETNAGWCHRFAPFRSFITNTNVIRAIRWFKHNYYQYGDVFFNDTLMRKYCGDNYLNYYYTKMLMKFIRVLCAATDQYGNIKQQPGTAQLVGDDGNIIQTSTNNKQLFETVGMILKYKYSDFYAPMEFFLCDVVNILTDFQCAYHSMDDLFFKDYVGQLSGPILDNNYNNPNALFPKDEINMIYCRTAGHYYNIYKNPNGNYTVLGWGQPRSYNNVGFCTRVPNFVPANICLQPRLIPMSQCHIPDRYKDGDSLLPGHASGVSETEATKQIERLNYAYRLPDLKNNVSKMKQNLVRQWWANYYKDISFKNCNVPLFNYYLNCLTSYQTEYNNLYKDVINSCSDNNLLNNLKNQIFYPNGSFKNMNII